MFNVQINKRLKDIKGSKDDFGGVIIAFADLFQHQPVKDGYIILFEDKTTQNTAFLLQTFGKSISKF